jgi:hypothetical protein
VDLAGAVSFTSSANTEARGIADEQDAVRSERESAGGFEISLAGLKVIRGRQRQKGTAAQTKSKPNQFTSVHLSSKERDFGLMLSQWNSY